MKIFQFITDLLSHPANRSQRWQIIYKTLYWQLFSRITNTSLDIDYHGLKLRCYRSSTAATRALYYSGMPDYWEMRFMQAYLKPGDTVLDIGANVGVYSLFMRTLVTESGFVHAFEPNPITAQRLNENCAINNLANIKLHNVGCSEQQNKIRFCTEGDASVAHIPSLDNMQAGDIEISTIRLDTYLEAQHFAMAKLDIEGYEPFAIRGMKNWLANNNPPVMQVEMAGLANIHGITTDQFIAELAKLGYDTMIYEPASNKLIAAGNHWERGEQNVLAVAREKLDFINQRLKSTALS